MAVILSLYRSISESDRRVILLNKGDRFLIRNKENFGDRALQDLN